MPVLTQEEIHPVTMATIDTPSPQTIQNPTPLKIEGHGLITGMPVSVEIEPGLPGQGIVFLMEGMFPVPARLENVINTDRGVTLGVPGGKFIAIVEHFLAGCAMAGFSDLKVKVKGAFEMPLLDGSAKQWRGALLAHYGEPLPQAPIPLKQAVFYRHNDNVAVYAIPSDRFQVSYAVDFDHPDLKQCWVHWDQATDPIELLAQCRTFGYVRELPILQAQGLARGVTAENTLGLTDEGGYTSTLRVPFEPAYHKALDLIGDMSLMGFNPFRLQAHVYALQAGHGSHTAFAKLLKNAL